MSVAKITPLPRTEMDALLLGRLDELTVSCESNARNKNYLGVAMSILVLMLISSMIVAAIVIINPDIVNFSSRSYGPHEAINLEESLLNELGASNFASQWLGGSLGPGGELMDELLIEDSKNLNIITMPPSERQSNNNNNRMRMANTANATVATNADNNTTTSSGGGGGGDGDDTRVKFEQMMIRGASKITTSLVANMSLLTSLEYQGFKLSPSRRYLLIWTNRRRRFRHSFTAKYFVYDIRMDLILMLSTKPSPPPAANAAEMGDDESTIGGPATFPHNTYEHLDSATHNPNVPSDDSNDNRYTRFQWVEWIDSPSGKSDGDSLVMVQNNDIFLVKSVANSGNGDITSQPSYQQHVSPTRITFTGKPDEIFNGLPDWLYEEEILGPVPAFQVSPLANTLAYMSFNDSQVEVMPYTLYGSAEQVIPKIEHIRYPKVGRVNPQVEVHLVDNWMVSADGGQRNHDDIVLELPDDLAIRQHYINRIKWLSNDNLALIWLNRHQNESYFVICSRNLQWKCQKNLHLTADGGWLDLSDDLVPIDDDSYLALIFKPEGPEVGSFKHIARVSLKQSDTYTYITGGRKEVISIDGLDKLNSLVYYTSTMENEPGQRQLFSARLTEQPLGSINNKDGGAGGGNCITCDHYPSECLYNFAKMSPSTNYYIFECDGPGIPRTELRTTKPVDEPLPMPLELSSPEDDGESGVKLQQQQPSILSGKNTNSILAHHQQQATGPLPAAPALGAHKVRATTTATSSIPKDSTLIWVMENNQALRDKLTHKAMPLTMRLKVPLPNTNYSANVIMLLPPEFGSTTTFRSPPTAAFLSQSARPGRARPRRGALPVGLGNSNGLDRPIHAHFTPESIADYTSQLPSGQQYPMVVDVYAGPGSQKVDFRYNINFGHYLTSSRRTIYAMIDGRGSGFEGTNRLYEMYNKFGTVEIQDQIEVANYLRRAFSFINPNKIAIWGWSYGGYASAMALAQSNARSLRNLKAQLSAALQKSNSSLARDPDGTSASAGGVHHHHPHRAAPGGVFECAVSVAPVTNWIYYDTAYTERYMSSPYLNELYDEHNSGDHNYQLYESSSAFDQTRNTSGGATNKWIPLNQIASTTTASASSNQHKRTITNSTPNSLSDLMKRGGNRMTNQMGSSLGLMGDLNERYRQASLLEHIGDIDRKRFLLIHGSADDNVHFQQSIMLMRKLINKNIMYETRVYPDQDHGIANRADKIHLGSTLSNFFAECFDMAY